MVTATMSQSPDQNPTVIVDILVTQSKISDPGVRQYFFGRLFFCKLAQHSQKLCRSSVGSFGGSETELLHDDTKCHVVFSESLPIFLFCRSLIRLGAAATSALPLPFYEVHRVVVSN